jgi:hypothetical protein
MVKNILRVICGLALVAVTIAELIVASAITLPARKKPLKVMRVFFSDGPRIKRLTKGEIACAQSIFGNEIPESDLAAVRKYYGPPKKKGTPASARPSERRINFYGAKYHEKDYSKAKDAFNFGTYFHEVTHLQQDQPSAKFREFVPNKHYDYTLHSDSRFDDFYTEQQAAIIEDYARRFLFLHADVPGRRSDKSPSSDTLLMKVVEDRFPEARKSRLRFESQKKAQAAARPNPLTAFRYGDPVDYFDARFNSRMDRLDARLGL